MVENYEDGELEGNFVEYDENENEITQGQYIDGQEDGVWLYVRGNAKERGSYYEGMRTGTWKTWYDDGKLASEIHYEQDLPDGKYVTYWPSGQQKGFHAFCHPALGTDNNGFVFITINVNQSSATREVGSGE